MTRNPPFILLLVLIDGCASRAAHRDDAGRLCHPFVETIPGSTVKFTMRPVTTWYDEKGINRARVIWFAETETTWDAYDVFYLRLDERAGSTNSDAITRPTLPYAPPDRGWGHGGYPTIGVTFHAAVTYCEWLSERTGRRYRLPTVSEWHDATWWAGDDNDYTRVLQESCWFADNTGGKSTQPVARLKRSADGVYDLLGNVAEWCVGDDGEPVVLGGSFLTDLANMSDEAANRVLSQGKPQSPEWNANDPAFPKSKWWLSDAPFVGFRVVCEEAP